MNSSGLYTFLFLFVLLFACSAPPNAPQEAEKAAPDLAMEPVAPPMTQLLVVTTDAWDAFRGTLQRFEGSENNWQAIGEPISIVVGKNGLGWSVHETVFQAFGGPIKKEGDLKSPAGKFMLGTAFGYAENSEAQWLKYPYWPVTSKTMCIEDVGSEYYNQIVEHGEVQADWKSTDHMRRNDELYEWGVFVEHNFPEAQPKAGSCIFLHVWNTKGGRTPGGTAGCTAMDKAKIKEVLAWLDEEKSQMMIQMPIEAYQSLQNDEAWPQIN
ncbi:MAG: L,D-transpeptidase [Bacteroidia bacterium]